MRGALGISTAVLCACAAAPRPVEAPVEPGPSNPTAPTRAALGCDDAWVLRVERHERTEAVGSCQIGPVDARSLVVAQERVLGRGPGGVTGMEIRVVQDDEAATGMDAAKSLGGRTFTATSATKGIEVRDAGGAGAPADATDVERVRGLAAIGVGWQGSAVLRPPASETGGRIATLEGAVLAMFDASLHGVPVPEAEAIVKVAAAAAQQAGDRLVFDVKVSVHEGDSGMCHTWTNDAELAGRLVVERGNGAFVSLDLKGPVSNTEALCQGDTTQRTCNHGSLEFRAKRECAAGR